MDIFSTLFVAVVVMATIARAFAASIRLLGDMLKSAPESRGGCCA